MSNAQVSGLRANVEGKAGDETVRNLELEQLRRQLHQLQTSSEVHCTCTCTVHVQLYYFSSAMLSIMKWGEQTRPVLCGLPDLS